MQDRYKNIFSVVKKEINNLDPIGLLKQGSPKDEYGQEIQRIVAGLKKCNNENEIQKLIYGIFEEYFGKGAAGNIDLYLNSAKNIFEQIKK